MNDVRFTVHISLVGLLTDVIHRPCLLTGAMVLASISARDCGVTTLYMAPW